MDPDQGHSEGNERPDWLPEKFNSPEDLARAYAAAETKITEQGQHLAAMNDNFSTLSEQLEELQAQQQLQAQPQQQQMDWYQMHETDPLGTQALLTQQIIAAELGKLRQEFSQQFAPTQDVQQQLLLTAARDSVASQHDDWNDFTDEIGNELDNNPIFAADSPFWSTINGASRAYETAYQIAKGKKIASGEYAQSDNREMKLAAQGISGGQSGRPDASNDAQASWERIRNAGGGDYASLISPRS